MASLDDQLYQLFSDLLKNSKGRGPLTFENKPLTTGNGPFLRPSEALERLYLGPRNSILGHGHPLTFKSKLESSLDPSVYCPCEDQIAFLDQLNAFIQKMTGLDIYASLHNDSAILVHDAGRHPHFLSKKSIEYIQSGKVVLIPNLFSFPIYLKNIHDDNSSSIYLAQESYISAMATLKLLSLGDFYGETGHIQRISQEIKTLLQDCPRVKSIDGLLIHLDQDRNYSFLDEGQYTIYLPLFFRPTFIKELNNFIME